MNSKIASIVHSRLFACLRVMFGVPLFVANGFVIVVCAIVVYEADSTTETAIGVVLFINLLVLQYGLFKFADIQGNISSYFFAALRRLGILIPQSFKYLSGVYNGCKVLVEAVIRNCLMALFAFAATHITLGNLLKMFNCIARQTQYFSVRGSISFVRKRFAKLCKSVVGLIKNALNQIWCLMLRNKLKSLYLVLMFCGMTAITCVFREIYLFYKFSKSCTACRDLPDYVCNPWFQVFVFLLGSTFVAKSLKSAALIFIAFWFAFPIGALLGLAKDYCLSNFNDSYLLQNAIFQYLFMLVFWGVLPAIVVFLITILRTKRWAIYEYVKDPMK